MRWVNSVERADDPPTVDHDDFRLRALLSPPRVPTKTAKGEAVSLIVDDDICIFADQGHPSLFALICRVEISLLQQVIHLAVGHPMLLAETTERGHEITGFVLRRLLSCSARSRQEQDRRNGPEKAQSPQRPHSRPQPRARSTELITGVARSAAMMLVRWRTSVTSISTRISKKSAERLVILRLVMLPWCLPMTVVRLPRLPGSLPRVTLMRPTCPASSPLLVQATSSQRSGVSAKLASASQSMVWMVTPFPVVTMPTMRSPGSGWQQPAKCSAMPGMSPRIETALSLAVPRRRTRDSGTTLSLSASGARGKAVLTTSRPVRMPSPTAT